MSGRRRLHLGHGTYGVTGLRLDDALGLLADLGYDGAGLTFDHMRLDPLAPGLAAGFRELGDVPLWRQRKGPVAGGKLPDATTRSNRSWTRSTPASGSGRSRQAAPAPARKKHRVPCRMAVVLPGPSPVRGSHGRLSTSDDNRPLVLLSTPRAVSGRGAAAEVKSFRLCLAGRTGGESRKAPAAPRRRKRGPL